MTLRGQIEFLQSLSERGDRIKEQRAQILDLRARLTERVNEINQLKQSNGNLKERSKAFEAEIAQQKSFLDEVKKLHHKTRKDLSQENEKLRKDLATAKGLGEDSDSVQSGDDSGDDDASDEGEEEEEEDELPDAVHDGLVYCCSECTFEVVDGYCQSCWTKHQWSEEMGKDTIPTQNEALVQDRQLSPRGTTPMREVGIHNIHRDYCGSGSEDRSEEYIELLRRGATRLMCETFSMEFNQATGIVAWADPSLYETFAGPDIQDGDFWKIHLGRRIELDDDDLDGSQFIEDLLEDAMIFPLRSDLSNRTHERWETVEERPGIWVTRPMASLEVEIEDDSDDSDENDSDCGEYGAGEDAENEARAKLERRGWVYQQNDAIRADDYETDADEDNDERDKAGEVDVKVEADSDAEEDVDVQMSDPGWTCNPREADATWPTILKKDDDDDSDADDDDDEGHAKENKGGEADDGKSQHSKDDEEYGNMAVDDFEVSDTADSDFDSDEVLSGDEAIDPSDVLD